VSNFAVAPITRYFSSNRGKSPRDGASRTMGREHWTIQEKLRVLEVVKEIGVKPAARQLNINLTKLKRWRRKADQLLALSKERGFDATRRVRVPGSGRPSKISNNLEGQMLAYFDEQRAIGINVNVRQLYLFACSIDASYKEMDGSNVKRRISRMLRHHKIVVDDLAITQYDITEDDDDLDESPDDGHLEPLQGAEPAAE
jgi:transposase-like protein